jgi:hypothetical protein
MIRVLATILAALGATSLSVALPALYQAYQIGEFSRSPDGHLAVIVPQEVITLPDSPKNYLVTLDPFRVFCQLPTKAEFSDLDRRGSLITNWAKDSSAAVMYVSLKWGPDRIFVVSIPKQGPPVITDLDSKIRELLQPDYLKAQVAPFNSSFDYIFDAELEGLNCWKINSANQVVIDCVATTDPENVPPSLHWIAHFEGLWDIAGQRFASHQFQARVSKDNE